jgi:hypothetical protein
LLIGIHAPVQGATDRFNQTASALNAGAFLWLDSEQPGDALRYPGALHVVRLPNWTQGMGAGGYTASVTARVIRWRSAVPDAVFQCGNEPNLEVGHNGRDFPRYAAAMRDAFPGIRLANPPPSVEGTDAITADVCAAADFVACHAYFERQHPEDSGNETFGASYRIAMQVAGAKPCIVTEFNVVQTNCPIDWPDRNTQAAAWLRQAEADGVHAAMLYIADAAPDWSSFDLGPEAATDILAHYRQDVPQAPPRPDPSPPEETGMYTRGSDPRGYVPLRAGWRAFIGGRNPGEADAIIAAYTEGCQAIRYDANLAIAQGCVETAVFTSRRWQAAHAAAGVGIYADGTPDVIWGEGTTGDVRTGVLAQIELLNDYYGNAADPWGIIRAHGFGFDAPLGKTRLADMDGVWAADTGYSAAIIGYANAVGGEPIHDVPAPPAPVAPTTTITGAMVAAYALRYLGSTDRYDYDPRNGHGTPYLWCEANAEAIPWHLTGIREPIYSALVHGQQLDAAGRLHHDTSAPAGAWMIWGQAFWPDGHIVISLGDGRYIGTTVDGIQIGSGWQYLPGFMGWAMPDGVVEGEGETDMRHDGKLDAGLAEYLWRVGRDSEGQPIALNPDSGLFVAWRADLLAGRPWGEPRSQEMPITDGSARVVQVFALGVAQAYPDGTVAFN